MKLTTLVLSTLTLSPAVAQKLNFARNVDISGAYTGLTHDRFGGSYLYGSAIAPLYFGSHTYDFQPNSADTIGSSLRGYNVKGQLVVEKRWKQPFWISDLRYDGADHFYASGTYSGKQVIEGHTLPSYGNTDCFLAKLDLQGNVVWVRTFGSVDVDQSGGLTYNTTNKKVVCTGSCGSSLYTGTDLLNGSTVRTTFLVAFDANGDVTSHALNHFPGNTGENGGYEITNAGDSYYLLHHRRGRSWANDTSSLPEEGVYLASLDKDLKMGWSKMIINGGCYYGYQCGRISQTNSGKCVVPRYCSHKYGGDGALLSYDDAGNVIWSSANSDGSYADTYATGENIYYIGTEGANGCPCESNSPGYQVLKKSGSLGNLSFEHKFPEGRARLMRVTVNEGGVITVFGYFYETSYEVMGTTLYNPHPGGAAPFMFSICEEQCPTEPTALTETVTEDALKVFPNPASDEVSVEMNTTSAELQFRLLDLTGQVLRDETLTADQGKVNARIDISALPKGIYMLEVRDAISVRRVALIRE